MGSSEADPLADVIVASVPTLGRMGSGMERLTRRFDPSRFKCIVIDEAHHAAAVTYCRILEYFGVIGAEVVEAAKDEETVVLENEEEEEDEFAEDLKSEMNELMTAFGETKQKSIVANSTSTTTPNIPPPSTDILLWGCSATLSRNDQLDLARVFEKVSYHIPFTRMIDEGWLCPLRLFQVTTEVDLDDVSIRRGDYDMTELSLAIDTPTRNDMVVATWKREALEEHRRKATLVFALNIAHVMNLARSFNQICGITPAIITGTTPEGLRAEILRRFGAGEIPVLINCAVLTEGTDLPITDCVLLTRPTCNDNLYIQMIGRGLRRHEDKEYCLVLDVIDRNRTGERSLLNWPSLFSLRGQPLTRDPNDVITEESSPSKPSKSDLCSDNLMVNVTEMKQPEHSFSPQRVLPWIRISQDRMIFAHYGDYYVLDVNRERTTCTIDLLKEEDCENKDRRSKTFQKIPITVDGPTAIGDALRILYRHLEDQVSPKGGGLSALRQSRATAGWRRRAPPTDGQIRMLGLIGVRVGGMRAEDLGGLRTWTVGRAHDVISKYQYLSKVLGKRSWEMPMWPALIEGIKNYS